MFLGTLQTRPVRNNKMIREEIGIFELQLFVEDSEFLRQPNKAEFIKAQISRNLAEQIFLTGVPAHVWEFYGTSEVRSALNLPFCLSFKERGQ